MFTTVWASSWSRKTCIASDSYSVVVVVMFVIAIGRFVMIYHAFGAPAYGYNLQIYSMFVCMLGNIAMYSQTANTVVRNPMVHIPVFSDHGRNILNFDPMTKLSPCHLLCSEVRRKTRLDVASD